MPFFQNSVINKYLKTLDKQKVTDAYVIFKEHFHNPVHQENIRNSKEEQYQEGFLTDLFVEVLGYTKNPKTNFNLTTEYKNIKDAKKVDGAIILNEKVKGVIELKGTDTTDLGKVEEQAFGYKNNQPECVYVIISNFEKLRFYIDNAIEHYEFNLFTLTEKEFELLYLCLAFENIVKDLPKQIKNESLSSEDVITKKLYADYSAFRRVLYQNIVQQNPQFDKLALFKKTQKLLDRFLFIFFAEDRQLLPPNSIRTILDQWKQLKELDSYKPLWERFKLYFHYMNVGRKGSQYDIFPYNGGLFLPDIMLDSITIDDDILYEHTLKLSNYDFDTEVDVDILGHIFEHSLNEIEEIQSQLEGKELDKSKTKRKKDGIFYTPKYITKYIVDNTVGKLCTEKKAELQINEADYISDKKIQKQTKQALADKLTQYRNWLLQIKICDPACGSGAFLNQALDFLIKEHRYIDELQAKLFGASLILSDIENSILENNLFGVDLNEESVEIARLSLWLRTARPNRKLNDLSNNIKCGNSLIDDPAVAGNKAFNWFLEFPQVFPHYRIPKVTIAEKKIEEDSYSDSDVQEPSYTYGPNSKAWAKYGFDVVIGNPPYVSLENIPDLDKDFFRNTYNVLDRKYDTSVIFNLRGLGLLRNNGVLGFITTITWQTGENYIKLREYLFAKFDLVQIINLPFNVFADAYVDTGIVVFKNCDNKKSYNIYCFNKSESLSTLENIPFVTISEETIDKKNWKIVLDAATQSVYNKFKNNDKFVTLGEITISTQGLSPSRFVVDMVNNDENALFPYLVEGQVYQYKFFEEKIGFTDMSDKISLIPFYEETPKILFRRLINRQDRLTVSYTDKKMVFKKDVNPFIITNENFHPKYILACLASKFISYLYVNTSSIATKDDFRQTTLSEIRNLPIVKLENESQLPFIQLADLMLSLNKQLQELSQKFQRNMQREFNLQDLPTKLQNWYQLSYTDFIKELDKKKIKLTLAQKAEWEEYFNAESKKANELKDQIDKTDAEIDNMVYQLYGLTPEEIEIVNGN